MAVPRLSQRPPKEAIHLWNARHLFQSCESLFCESSSVVYQCLLGSVVHVVREEENRRPPSRSSLGKRSAV